MGPSDQPSTGGTGSEIVGKAEYPDSGAAAKCLAVRKISSLVKLPVVFGNIFCYPRSFVPDTSWVTSGAFPRTYTDSTGAFRILDAPPGEVVVQVNDGSGFGIAQTIMIDRDSTVYPIGVLTVQKTGAIAIQAHTQLPGRVRFYVSVRGTQLVVRGSQTDIDITLDRIPSGIPHTINVRVYEPMFLEFDINSVSVPIGGVTLLQAFEIR